MDTMMISVCVVSRNSTTHLSWHRKIVTSRTPLS